MKIKNSFFYTLREDSKEEDSISSNLLVRSGMIKKNSAGVYIFMPMGYRVLEKIKAIVKKEMDLTGSQELLMPCLIPEEVYKASGRRDTFGNSMFSLKDRMERDYVLGPTHEELFVLAAAMKIQSYKDMPFNLYQMATKFRDEARPRYGVIRVREFIMKDAYSFDCNLEGLDSSYQKMFDAYKKIFDTIGIDYKIVRAGTGAMGGLLSEEFQAITDIGEDTLVLCKHCGYASNLEVSACLLNQEESKEVCLPIEKVHTPNHGTVEEIASFLEVETSQIVKTILYKIDGKYYACLVAGDREVCEAKLESLLEAHTIELASSEEVEEITKANIGFAGPIGLEVSIIIDQDIAYKKNFIVGANETDYHYKNVNISNFKYDILADIKEVRENDPCPVCHNELMFKKGIEIGNTFKLGTKYSESMNLYYSDENNQLKPVVMGCYGIGIGRIMAAYVEQNHDEAGLIWPMSIAPYQIALVVIQPEDEIQKKLADSLYETLQEMGFDVLYDDRIERPGVKFKDMDLIGIPIRITVGKDACHEMVEYKLRRDSHHTVYTVEELKKKLSDPSFRQV